MLIDWFTVAAQIVNFLILVYLLKRFLYEPILRHMQEREEKIKGRLQEAAEKEATAEEKIETYRAKEEALEDERAAKLRKAEEEAEQRQKELLNEAREEAEDARRRWLEALEREKQSFGRELKQRTCRQILELTRRALQDLADQSLNNRLAAVLLQRLEGLEKNDRKKLAQAGGEGIAVRSSFELEATEKRRITTVLHQICGKQAEVDYQVDPEYPLGIEASAGSLRLAWSVAGYLDELQENVLALLEEKHQQAQEDQAEEKRKDQEQSDEEQPQAASRNQDDSRQSE
ncbi:MAG TPA: hypothetical protein VJ910_03695 [Desulfuromonadales bacterium]|nr:hypothetical protein [Desulfuromonadales bacterium]